MTSPRRWTISGAFEPIGPRLRFEDEVEVIEAAPVREALREVLREWAVEPECGCRSCQAKPVLAALLRALEGNDDGC